MQTYSISNQGLQFNTHKLLNRMLSPLCGINEEIGFSSRGRHDSRVIITGAAITGVHALQGRPNPGRGAYHIGGTGYSYEEALIKSLGESVERYSQLVSEIANTFSYQFCSYAEIIKKEKNVLSLEKLKFFSQEQYAAPGFIFQPFDEAKPLGWIQLFSVTEGKDFWVPAQLILVGYQIRRDQGEPWLSSAVTTGTASHVERKLALRNALYELIQLDSTMGHWYGQGKAYEIIFDDRTAPLENLIKNYEGSDKSTIKFYWLPNPDLPTFSIAFLCWRDQGLPSVATGLGADFSLICAMYKAYLEGVASIGLSRIEIFKSIYEKAHLENKDPSQLFDLDSNVTYYGLGHNFNRIQERFFNAEKISARHLPLDDHSEISDQISEMVNAFKASGKQLFFCDLTGVEAESLGFYVPRVWSPDTLSLSLPSAPLTLHPRYQAYQGVTHQDPHPYA